MLPEVELKVRVHGRHPWFFRKMVRRPEPGIAAGSAVRVKDRDGRFVGTGFYNNRTELALRMLCRAEVDDPDAALGELLDQALDLREGVLDLPARTDGYRLVHSEGDGFPGLVLDRLGEAIVAQLFSLCMQQRIEAIGEQLLRRFPSARLVLTVDALAQQREGMAPVPKPGAFECDVREHGLVYRVCPGDGHKTGFFADQRDNRALCGELARGRRVLDLFCNAGGFALNAARGGAKSVLAADLDEHAVARAQQNAALNELAVDVRHGDAFDILRDAEAGRRHARYDLIVLDPPKWAAGKGEVDDALQRYHDLNRLGFAALDRGGLLLTCSCSGAVGEERFLHTLRAAAAAARRDVRILSLRGAGPDHPVALECPETRYLKVVVAQVR